MPLPFYYGPEYGRAILALLPRGPAWPREPSSIQHKLAFGLGPCMGRLNTDANGLVVDAFPSTAVNLLPEWEATLGLPSTGTTSQRQAAVVAALESQGGSSVAYFQGLVQTYGFRACTILQYKASTVRSGVGRPLVGVQNVFRWTVTAYGTGNHTTMEAALQRFKPAHTTVDFVYLP